MKKSKVSLMIQDGLVKLKYLEGTSKQSYSLLEKGKILRKITKIPVDFISTETYRNYLVDLLIHATLVGRRDIIPFDLSLEFILNSSKKQLRSCLLDILGPLDLNSEN